MGTQRQTPATETARGPAGACDCHVHCYDPAHPVAPVALLAPPPQSDADACRRMLGAAGLERVVIVTPSTYGHDNRVTTAAIARINAAARTLGGSVGLVARGVAVLPPDCDDASLDALHAAGIRGLRFQGMPGSPPFEIRAMRPLAERLARRGWLLQFHLPADRLLADETALAALPCNKVIDHFGRIPLPAGIDHPAFAALLRLLDSGRTWVKLAGAYHDSVTGPPGYADSAVLARTLIGHAPGQMIWGSDWPYPSLQAVGKPCPDPGQLLAQFRQWVADPVVLRRILVDTPAALYDFPRR